MIRKPSQDDFREATAVRALRESGTLAVEGGKGVGRGFNRLLLYWFGGVTAFAFCMSFVVATYGLGLIPLAGGTIWFFRHRNSSEAMRMQALRRESERMLQADFQSRPTDGLVGTMDPARSRGPFVPANQTGDVPFPSDVRRHGCIKADIGAVMQQSVVMFIIGFGIILMLGRSSGVGVGVLTGIVVVMLAVLIASRIFGHRKLIEWDTQTVRVWHLLSEGHMQWSDVSDVTVEKSSRWNLGVYFQSGSRRNIVLMASINRLGGPNTLRVPIRYTGLPKPALELLLRDLFCWCAAGNPASRGAASEVEPLPLAMPAITPSSDPRENFDPDAIMANYMRQRAEVVRAAGREDEHFGGHKAPHATIAHRPVFGRKGA